MNDCGKRQANPLIPLNLVSDRALKDFVAILNKEMNPQVAMVKGKIKVRGDIMSVMALTKLL
ncbi:SCP2 sterol-binding domain-containing protein [Sphingobium sp. AR-3-1]|uniref:SCP2 sterol-binding domain-containing protein n=1 Tax=Sphingobium psychrophilum TaxID=2728834 RepID=A0A7X9X098_9SPHN|nr:SCP2 sterol-binding domain-containing protein [Sphingobium psychrophilum]